MSKVADVIYDQIFNLCIWCGSENYRWKMKNLGWNGWGVSGVTETAPEPEGGYEK